MSHDNPDPAVARALALSEEILSAAESGDLESLESLDRQRLELLKSFWRETKRADAPDRALLEQISQINDRTIGLLEHQRRSKGRDIDMAAVGRRAVAAYSNNRLQR